MIIELFMLFSRNVGICAEKRHTCQIVATRKIFMLNTQMESGRNFRKSFITANYESDVSRADVSTADVIKV